MNSPNGSDDNKFVLHGSSKNKGDGRTNLERLAELQVLALQSTIDSADYLDDLCKILRPIAVYFIRKGEKESLFTPEDEAGVDTLPDISNDEGSEGDVKA